MNVERKGIQLLKRNCCYLLYLSQSNFFVVLFIQV